VKKRLGQEKKRKTVLPDLLFNLERTRWAKRRKNQVYYHGGNKKGDWNWEKKKRPYREQKLSYKAGTGETEGTTNLPQGGFLGGKKVLGIFHEEAKKENWGGGTKLKKKKTLYKGESRVIETTNKKTLDRLLSPNT